MEEAKKIDVVKMLKEIQYLNMNKMYLIDKYKEVKSKSIGIKSQDYSQVLAGSHVSNPNNAMDLNLIQQEELHERLAATREKIKALHVEVTKYIERLEPKERTLIELHYLDGETLEYICSVINYSFRHTHRIHKKALQKLSEMA